VQVGRAPRNHLLEQLVDRMRCSRHASGELSADLGPFFTPALPGGLNASNEG
jgi:hypothetical protein